jgi:DNA polymerase III alpha subunit
MNPQRYAELQVTTHFSFLRGASSCDELFETARATMPTMKTTDTPISYPTMTRSLPVITA